MRVALVGNPNTGKSTIFNNLTGLRQHTGNWAGKTVENAVGSFSVNGVKVEIVDLPGMYSLFTKTAEEETAKEFITAQDFDITVVVLDSTSLERSLALALQIMSVNERVILCANLTDEADKKGITVDIELLSDILGIPVVATNARGGQGISELKHEIIKMQSGEELENRFYLSGDKTLGCDEELTQAVERAAEISKSVVTCNDFRKPDELDRKIDRIITSKILGLPIMLVMLAGIFWLTIIGSNYPSEGLRIIFNAMEIRLIELAAMVEMPEAVSGLLIKGMFRTLSWVVSVMLPPMAIFFPLFTILEDFGVLPRIALNLDGSLQKVKAHGKQALTMCIGNLCYGRNTPVK